MTIDLVEIKSVAEELGLLATATNTKASARKSKLDAKPEPPVNALVDADWNDYQDDLDTWKDEMAIADSELVTATNAQKAKEKELVALIPPNQWVFIDTLLNWRSVTEMSLGHGSSNKDFGYTYIDGLFFITAAEGEASSVFPGVQS